MLTDDNLSDERKSFCTMSFSKNTYLKKNKDLGLVVVGLANPKTLLLEHVWSSIANLRTPQQNENGSLIRKIEKFPNFSINHQFELVYKGIQQHLCMTSSMEDLLVMQLLMT